MLGSYDGQTYYDRVVHSLTSLVGQSVGMSIPSLTYTFLAIEGMSFYLRTQPLEILINHTAVNQIHPTGA